MKSPWAAAATMALGAVALAGAACADEGGGGVTCPPGTTAIGDMCIRRGEPPAPPDAGLPGPGLDAAIPPPPPAPDAASDAPVVATPEMGAPDTSPAPPPPPPPDGGSIATGSPCASQASCSAWARALVDGVNAHRTREGCSTRLAWDDRVASVAQEDADLMAENRSLADGLPDLPGSLEGAGVRPTQAASFGGTTRTGPDDPLGRWLSRSDVAARLADCSFEIAGAGFATDASADESYGRLVLASE